MNLQQGKSHMRRGVVYPVSIIQINGWNGATFEVTETIGAVPFSVGEKFEFSFAF